MRQLHLATQQMALDGITTGDTNFGWPGDTGGTFTSWTAQILKGGDGSVLLPRQVGQANIIGSFVPLCR